MKPTRRSAAAILAAGAVSLAANNEVREEDFQVDIRGRRQTLRRLIAHNGESAAGQPIVVASGDGGFHSFGSEIARELAKRRYDVYRFNTQHYLKSFTGHSELTPKQAQADLAVLVEAVGATPELPAIFLGWSAGAALAVLAGAGDDLKHSLRGVVTAALPLEGVLGWRWSDNLQFLPGFKAAGPYFDVTPYLKALPPTPVLMLQSDEDVWVSDQDAEELFAAAQEPKRTVLIRGGGHSFPDAREEFFRALHDGLDWMTQTQRG